MYGLSVYAADLRFYIVFLLFPFSLGGGDGGKRISKNKRSTKLRMFYTDTHTRSLLNTRFRAQKRSKFTIRLTGKIPLSALFRIVKEKGTKRLYICVCVFFYTNNDFLIVFLSFPTN